MALTIFLSLLSGFTYGQVQKRGVELSPEDIKETALSYRTTDIAKSVTKLKERMPKPVVDAKARKGIIDGLPVFISKLRVIDEKLEKDLRNLLAPSLKLYGREGVYDFIIVRHPAPLIFSDSGIVLVITTGALVEVQNDDELIALIAHEIGHEYFARYSIYTRHLLKLVADAGEEPALTRHLNVVLAIVESQCDAFAAISAAHLGYDPFAFLDWLDRVAEKFPDHSIGAHPREKTRREITAQLFDRSYVAPKKRRSDTFSAISKMVQSLNIAVK